MLALLLVIPLQAADTNMQKIYPVHSETAEAVRNLAISSGSHTPSSAGPWSQAELLSMLRSIDGRTFTKAEAELYKALFEELSEGKHSSVSPDPGLSVNIEATAHTSSSHFTDYDWIGGFGRAGDMNIPSPMVFLPYSITIGRGICMYSELQLGLNRTVQSQMNPIERGMEMTFTPMPFRTNILFLPPSVLIDFNMNFPYRAIIAAGSDEWYFSIGREKLSWGPGVSGNLMVGDQVPYHNNARFCVFTDHFKYTFSVSSFIHPSNYTFEGDDGKTYIDLFFDQDRERTGTKAFIAHRVELFAGKFTGALTEAIIYQSQSGAMDLSVLSPMALFHNYYIRHNANSMLSAEIEFAASKNLSVYGVLLIDEFNFPTEFSDPSVPPPALGFQLGATASWVLEQGILSSKIEGVYTDPYLYIRDDGSRSGDGYGINAIIAFPDFINSPSSDIHFANYELMFLGYRYGNDTVALCWNTSFRARAGYELEFDFTYLAKGVKDKYTRWKTGDFKRAPSTSQGESYLIDSLGRDAVAHSLIFTLQGGCEVSEHMRIDASLREITVINAGNRSDGGCISDFQLTAKLSYTF